MFGKFFASAFTGSMFGAGPDVFAVWGYVIAHTVNSQVELNPRPIAAAIGMSEERVSAAIELLCAPDTRSRNKDHEGRRLIREGEYAYFVPSHERYRAIRDENDRREYNRTKKAEGRARGVNTRVKESIRVSSVSAQAEADTEAEADTKEDDERGGLFRDIETALITQYGPEWEPVAALLESREPHTRSRWVKEVATLTVSYGPEVVSRACNDALAAPQPLRMPSGLRAGCAGIREHGKRASSSASPASDDDKLMAWAKAQDAKEQAAKLNGKP